MGNFLIFLNPYLFVILIWQNSKHSECKHSFILCNWEIMEKVTQLGSQHFSIPIVFIWSLCFPSLFNDTSELLHSFQSSSLISLRPTLSWWPYLFFYQKEKHPLGMSSASHHQTDMETCICIMLNLCSQSLAHSSSQPNFSNRYLCVLSFP